MSADRTLERTDPDWRLYVADFPSDQWSPNGWVSARVHVNPTARPKVEQQTHPHLGPLVWMTFGPHFQCFIPRAVAVKLRDKLCSVLDERIVDAFSAGASEDATPPCPTGALVVPDASGVTAPAPAETPVAGI